MADAEDLKSSGDFSSCGFDSHPGHHCFCFIFNQLRTCVSPRNRRVTFASRRTIGSRLQARSRSASSCSWPQNNPACKSKLNIEYVLVSEL
jgi:hypothetical protein